MIVSRDNSTRWNSTYTSISRALKLRSRIETFSHQNRADLKDDILSEEDWKELQTIHDILKRMTLRLEGRAEGGDHGSIWEALPAIEILLKHLEDMKKKYLRKDHDFIAPCVNLAWEKLDEYYKMMDDSPAFCAALFLHPLRRDYIDRRWITKESKQWVKNAKTKVRRLYDEEYRSLIPEDSLAAEKDLKELDIMDEYFEKLQPKQRSQDEYKLWSGINLTMIPRDTNPYDYWGSQEALMPRMAKFAFDILSIPAMSTECERVFSGAKLMITDQRNRLKEDIIEASECLNRWYKAGLLTMDN